MNKVIISDTSCLIALSKIQRLDILHNLFPRIITTTEIASEFGEPLPFWIEVVKVSDFPKKNEWEQIVDKGEASAIALAWQTPNSLLINR
jgi:predicted nucleic acid-binding protein